MLHTTAAPTYIVLEHGFCCQHIQHDSRYLDRTHIPVVCPQVVAPKRAALAEANTKLQGAEKKLSGIRAKVAELNAKVASLEANLMKATEDKNAAVAQVRCVAVAFSLQQEEPRTLHGVAVYPSVYGERLHGLYTASLSIRPCMGRWRSAAVAFSLLG